MGMQRVAGLMPPLIGKGRPLRGHSLTLTEWGISTLWTTADESTLSGITQHGFRDTIGTGAAAHCFRTARWDAMLLQGSHSRAPGRYARQTGIGPASPTFAMSGFVLFDPAGRLRHSSVHPLAQSGSFAQS